MKVSPFVMGFALMMLQLGGIIASPNAGTLSDRIWRRPNDMDYISYVANDAVQAQLARGGPVDPELLKRLPHVPVPSHAYRNEGGLRFTDMATAWGLGEPGFANGAAYVDLDNDGALDLVVNQLNAPAAIYRNRARARTGAEIKETA